MQKVSIDVHSTGAAAAGAPGAKFLRVIERQLAPLKDLSAHGNRTLHLHPLVLTLVASFYDPVVRSLRAIEQVTLEGPLTELGLRRMARSTTADALAAFDPQLLRGVIDDLRRQIPNLARHGGDDARLAGIVKKIVAADGSYFSIFANVVWALHHTRLNGKPQGQVRMNLQMSTEDWVPEVVTLSGGDDAIDGSEPDALAEDLLRGVLYVVDRNFIDFDFIAALLAKENDLVLRIKSNMPAYEIVESRALTADDRAAGVISDSTVRLTGRGAPARLFRVVEIRHASKPNQTVKLLTTLTDAQVPAHVVGEVYRQRWQIELFFRWLKVWCNFDHLLSTSRRGITMQFYVTVIATLLMHIHLGRRVNKFTLIAMRQIASGQATSAAMRAFLDRYDRELASARRRYAAKRAAKKA